MKKLFFWMTSLLLFSCSAEEVGVADIECLTPISFRPEYAVGTRATDTSFENKDEIGVYIVKREGAKQGEIKSSGNFADNHGFVYSNGSFSCSPQLYYPTDGSNVDIYACYPRVNINAADNIKFNVKTDQSIGNNYTLSDLMIAREDDNSPSSQSIPLSFSHILSKIVFNLDESIPEGNTTVTICGVSTGVVVDLVSFVYYVSTASVNDVITCPVNTRSYKVLLPPQLVKAGSEYVKVTINGTKYTFKAGVDLDWEMGMEYTYRLKFSN